MMLSLGMLCCVLLLAGCADSKKISMVKNGILELDKSRTVKQAFQSKLSSMKWRVFHTQNNKTVVEVSGVWKSDKHREGLEKAKADLKDPNEMKKLDPFEQSMLKASVERAEKLAFSIPYAGDQVLVQFIINADDTFIFVYGELQDKDGNIKRSKNGLEATTSSFYSHHDFLGMMYE